MIPSETSLSIGGLRKTSRLSSLPLRKADLIYVVLMIHCLCAAMVNKMRIAALLAVGLSHCIMSSSSKPLATSLAFTLPSFSVITHLVDTVNWPMSGTSSYA